MSETHISVLMLTQNSARTVERTLDSLKDFQEVVVIDGGSTDNTEKLCKQYANVKFYHNPWPGFIEQRNYSISKATYEWCFMMDSDEVCTPELSREVHRLVADPAPAPLYRVKRTEYICGQQIEYGIGNAQYQERLFQKSRVKYTGGNHHSHLLDGKLVDYRHPEVVNIDPSIRILHDDTYDFDDFIIKFHRFIILEGREKIASGKDYSAVNILFTSFTTFTKTFAKSFQAGKVGFLMSMLHTISKTLIKLYVYQYRKFGVKKDESFYTQLK